MLDIDWTTIRVGTITADKITSGSIDFLFRQEETPLKVVKWWEGMPDPDMVIDDEDEAAILDSLRARIDRLEARDRALAAERVVAQKELAAARTHPVPYRDWVATELLQESWNPYPSDPKDAPDDNIHDDQPTGDTRTSVGAWVARVASSLMLVAFLLAIAFDAPWLIITMLLFALVAIFAAD